LRSIMIYNDKNIEKNKNNNQINHVLKI